MGRKVLWGVMTVLASAIASYALIGALVPPARGPFMQSLVDEKTVRALAHFLGGGVALLLGAFQFNATLRDRRPAVHRLVGQTYLVAVAIGGLAALALAPTSKGGPWAHPGFALLAIAWVTTSLVAYRQALAGEYDIHRDWMTRSYALCLAAVTLRVYVPLSQAAGIDFNLAYATIAWLCWVPNLLAAEWLIATRRAASSARRADARLRATRSSP